MIGNVSNRRGREGAVNFDMPNSALLKIATLLSVFLTSNVISFVDHHFDTSFSLKPHQRIFNSNFICSNWHRKFSHSLELRENRCLRQALVDVQPPEKYTDDFDDEAIRLQAKDFFNDLRGVKSFVSVSDLATTYYFEEILQDGVATKKTLSDLAGGRRLMNFELFYSVCSSLNRLQDEFFIKLSDDAGEIERRDEARRLFNELRGEGLKVSVAALKELYYFDEMLADGVITKERLSKIIGRKRLLDFESFYRLSLEFDKLDRLEKESSNLDIEVDKMSHEGIKLNVEKEMAQGTASDYEEEMEIRREMTEDEVENARIADEKEARDTAAILGLFNKLSFGYDKVSIQSFNEWNIVKNMISEGSIEEETVNYLTGLLGITDNELNLTEFEQLLRLFDESTGSGIIEVRNYMHRLHDLLCFCL